MDSHGTERILRSAWGGVWITLLSCGAAGAYAASTWHEPHRAAIVALIGGALGFGLLVPLVPLRRLLATRTREVAFTLCWNLGVILLIATGTALDGGVRSPLSYLGFVALVFASVSYSSTRLVAAVAGVDMGSFVLVGLVASETAWAHVMLFLGCLTIVGGACVWQTSTGRRQRRELALASRTDPLTGCLNRRGVEEKLEAALVDARRDKLPLSLIQLDFDNFKAVNDTNGHAAGDAMLVQAVKSMRAVVRDTDVLGRMGGDEFAIVAVGTGRRDTEALAERLEAAIAPASASVGIALFPVNGETADDLQRAADDRMYEVKRARAAVA
ncbi:MAG: diguanylate cyclase domain-containing protein [Thermoleophilaceae bacterium]